MHWPPTLFDEELGRCQASRPAKERGPTYAADLEALTARAGGRAGLAKLVSDNNLLIGQAQAKVNDVFVEYRLSKQPLTVERFLQDYNTEGSKTDFVTYFYQKIIERHRKGVIWMVLRRPKAAQKRGFQRIFLTPLFGLPKA